ncbi:MAG TPA: hypothetical protein VKV77_13480 [Methylovirgula sp.]|nr:hypothetical protein [Methylovirgula sp.]
MFYQKLADIRQTASGSFGEPAPNELPRSRLQPSAARHIEGDGSPFAVAAANDRHTPALKSWRCLDPSFTLSA